jgi:hypothetical protein
MVRYARARRVFETAALVAIFQACALSDLDGLTGGPARAAASGAGDSGGAPLAADGGLPIFVDGGGSDRSSPPDGASGGGAEDGGIDVGTPPPDGASLDGEGDLSDGAIAPPLEIVHVQNVVQIGNGTTMTATFPGAVQAGDLLVGVFRGSGTVSISDNVNGSWTQVFGLSNVYLFYLPDSGAAGAGSLVLTIDGSSSGSLRLSADDFSGVATSSPLDAQSTGSNSGGTSWSAGSTPSVAAGELVYAGAGTAGNNELFAPLSTAGVPMTVGGQATSASDGSIFSEYVLSSVAGAQNAGADLTPSSGGDGINGGQLIFRP